MNIADYGFAIWETFYVTVLSTAFALVLGLPLGVLLVAGDKDGILPLPGWLMHLINIVINILRSVPFLILMICVFPLTRAIVGTTVGTKATVVPLVVAAFPFVARLVETSLRELDEGVVEAAQSMGATPFQIITKVMIPECLPGLISSMTTALTTILGYSAMSGVIGGGGLGKIALSYGYYRYQTNIMIVCVVLLSGAMGGVALSRLGYMGEVALSVAAIIGALSVMALIVYVSQKVKGNVTLLIIGVMIGYVASAVIGVLKYFSVEEDIRAYVIWGLGSFARVSGDQMLLFVCIMAVLLPLSFLLIKTMNLLLLGDGYARNLGLNIKRARLLVISCSGVLVAIVTAYCGPIMFIGLAVPHLCRAIFHTSDHRILMPATLLVGAALALVCNLIARMPGFEGALPVNSVTALVGAPVVASVLFRKRKGELNE